MTEGEGFFQLASDACSNGGSKGVRMGFEKVTTTSRDHCINFMSCKAIEGVRTLPESLRTSL
jgi:hypothetical protein